jgi:myo-inositol-1(or 4)-monophosphatase
MAMSSFRPETVVAIDAVKTALVTAREGTGEVHFKEGRDVVTDTDVLIEDAIRAEAEGAFGFPVIGEERGGAAPEGTPYWLVDPICGTRNFASHIPLFAINMALVEDGEVVVAVVGDGSTGELHIAERGRGAWSLRADLLVPLSVDAGSQVVDFEGWPPPGGQRDRAARFVTAGFTANHWDIRCLSSTLALAYVAAGRLAACVLFKAPSSVHVAAGSLLVLEAGGSLTDLDRGRWTVDSTSMLASGTEEFHHELLVAWSASQGDM